MLTKNLFEVRQTRRPRYQILISRRTICDTMAICCVYRTFLLAWTGALFVMMARKCAEILEKINGLSYWLDEDDECMKNAQAENDDIKTALCIEEGLW